MYTKEWYYQFDERKESLSYKVYNKLYNKGGLLSKGLLGTVSDRRGRFTMRFSSRCLVMRAGVMWRVAALPIRGLDR